MCPEASIITIPRDELKDFDRVRGRLMNDVQSGLSNVYDWIIQSDADELVCLDPEHHGSFQDLFAAAKAPALFGLGLNIAEIGGDKDLEPGEMALAHRSVACVTGNYSKAWAVGKAMPLRWHGVFCGYRRTESFPFEMPEGVYFAHLKHANLAALKSANNVRRSVAKTVGDDWNVQGWAKPDFHAKRFFARLAEMDETPWDDAVALGRKEIGENPIRDPKRGIVKPPFINYLARTTLPDWFKSC
tara:strand:+ start:282 stop:1013 length:732 start_codon:yes stop_codon:yes gene_type:complete